MESSSREYHQGFAQIECDAEEKEAISVDPADLPMSETDRNTKKSRTKP